MAYPALLCQVYNCRFTLYLDDKERVIAQIERNDGKSLHALDLEAGADKAAREAEAKVEKQYSEQSDPTDEGNVKSERLVSDTLRSNSEPHKIAENVPVRELTRDFDIS